METVEDGGGGRADDDVGVGNGLATEDMDNVTHCSVVLHVDLDCFYASVEQVRLGIPKEKPLAVQQWRGLIAINYPARTAGITRHERADQALKKCPELVLVHVETIGEEGETIDAPSRGHTKVSLERYRQASASVFSIFRRFSNVYEKASIDEAYLDVTAKVEEMLGQGRNWDHELQRLLENNEQGSPTMVVLDGPLVLFNSYDRRMLAGAIIADQIRASVRTELGYTCSVGIATNKLLAKIASAKNKPDRQTVVPPRAVPGLMQTIPLKKMRLLGGKLGEELTQKWGFSTAGEAQALSLSTLVSCFGERQGNYVWNAVRGIQADKVQAKQAPKSMLAAKSFSPTKELSDIRRWLNILSEELAVRMLRDFQQHHRHPRLLQLYYRSGGFKHAKDHSKSWSMPHGALNLLSSSSALSHQTLQVSELLKEPPPPEDEQEHVVDLAADGPSDSGIEGNQDDVPLAEDLGEDHPEGHGFVVTETSRAIASVLENAAFNMFKRLEGTFPCTRLALAASGFQDLGPQGTKSIEHFFSNAAAAIAGTTVSPKKPKSNSKETKCKQGGIMKYLHHASSTQDDKANLEAGDWPDGPHSHGNGDSPNELSEKGHVEHRPRSLPPLGLDPASEVNFDQTSVAEVTSDGPTAVVDEMPHPSGNRRCLSVNEDVVRKNLRTGNEKRKSTSSSDERSVENFHFSGLGTSESVGNIGSREPDITDLSKVDTKEQMRILADIQRPSTSAPVSGKQAVKQSSHNHVKRSRQSNNGQQSIGKFFQAQSKPA